MNLSLRVRRAIAVVAIAGSLAGATGAARADSPVSPEPMPTEAPIQPTTGESTPGDDAGGTVTPPAASDGVDGPASTTPVESTEPPVVPPTTTAAMSTEPPVAPPTTTLPPSKPPVTTTPSLIAAPPTTTPIEEIATLATSVPTAPRSPAATAGNGSVKLTWLAPASNGGAIVDKYAVQRYTSTGWVNVSFPTALSSTVGSLTNGTPYSFRVRAHNAVGWGPVSSVVSAVPRTVPGAPTGLVVTPANSSVKLAWKQPASNGATIDTYAVQKYDSVKGWVNVSFPTALSYTVGSLTNGTKYSFRIRAHNAVGWGPVSSVVSAVPFTTPSGPSKCTADQWGYDGHTLLVQWWASPSDGGSPAQFTEVRVRQAVGFNGGGTGPWLYEHVAQPGSGFKGFAHVPFGWYEINVRVWNAAGPGAACLTYALLWY
jgi:hypothetical protein